MRRGWTRANPAAHRAAPCGRAAKHGLRLAIVAALVLAAPPAFAAEPIEINVSLSEQRVNTGDSLTMEINVTSRVDGAIEMQVPEVDGLTELSRSRSEGTSISWSGRGQQVTREYTITIELEATKPGKLTIPPISARAGGKTASSRPIIVEVLGPGAQEVPPAKAEPGYVEPPGAGEQRLFLRYKVDRASAYVGQQILLDLDVYAAPSLNFGIDENAPPPTLDGFWREVVEQPQRLTRRTEVVAGRTYQVYRLWRLAVFPLEAGERTIPPVQITFAVNRSIFGGGQRDRRRPPPVVLDVKPLPAEGKPPSFASGNVGAYKLAASVDHSTVPAGKAVVLTVSLSGRGNVKNARLPELGTIPGFRVFPPTVSDNVTIDASGVHGEKKAEILLMPETGGRLEIPSLELVVFNPEAERYERLTTSSIRIAVEGDPAALAPSQTLPAAIDGRGLANSSDARAGEPARLTKSEMRPLRFRSSLARHAPAPWQDASFGALLFAPPLFYLLVLLGELVVARSRRETPESRRRAAARHARARLEKAREAAAAGDGGRVYHELMEALLDFATEKTGVAFRGKTTEEMRDALAARGAPAALVDRFTTEVEAANYARFVPGAGGPAASVLERWEALLSELEQWEVKA